MYHAHFVMNSVSFIDGKMFANSRTEIYQFLQYIKAVTRDNSWTIDYNCYNGRETVSDDSGFFV